MQRAVGAAARPRRSAQCEHTIMGLDSSPMIDSDASPVSQAISRVPRNAPHDDEGLRAFLDPLPERGIDAGRGFDATLG